MEYIPLLRVCLLVIGVLNLLCFLRILYQLRKSKRWPTITGEILSSKLLHFGWDDEDSSKSYKASIKYQYKIGGEIYTSKKNYYGDWIAINFSSYMRKIVKQYNIGEKCTVHYNPQKPKKSVLRVTLAPPVYSLLLSSILFTAIGVYLCCI